MPKDRLVFKLKLLPLALLSCCAGINQAQASGYLPPRLSLDANAGGSATVGQADLLLSLKGDERRNLYLDPQASYGTDEQWYADLGLGYRWIQNDAAILGGYLFAGHSQVANQSGFWIANPGVEALGSRWDARINGYIPIGSRSDDKGVSQFILSRQPFYTGHTAQIITNYVNVDETQQIGDGVDAKVGYQVFRHVPFKAYLGGYFFDIRNTNNVRGGAAGVEYWFDRTVKVFAHYTYDNLQHSTVVGGLAVSFGGVDEPRADPSLSERLTDPVERYLANLGHGSGIPSEMISSTVGAGSFSPRIPLIGSRIQIMSTSMAFFSQAGAPNNGGVGLSLANCTFENPCAASDFTQTGVNTLNALLPNTMMFFNGGTYPATNGSSAITLNNGQGVFGTTANYVASAQGAARPTFSGAFILAGNNTLDSIILNNSLAANTTAITSTGGQNLVINNVVIGSGGTPYAAAMNLANASATLTRSSVNTTANLPTPSFGLTGILLTKSSLLVQSSNINIASTNAFVQGIALTNGSALQFSSSQLSVSQNLGSGTTIQYADAIDTSGVSTATINNGSSITITTNGLPTSSATVFTGLGVFDTSTNVMNGGTVTVFGPTGSAFTTAGYTAFGTPPTNITFANVACVVNSIAGCTIGHNF